MGLGADGAFDISRILCSGKAVDMRCLIASAARNRLQDRALSSEAAQLLDRRQAGSNVAVRLLDNFRIARHPPRIAGTH